MEQEQGQRMNNADYFKSCGILNGFAFRSIIHGPAVGLKIGFIVWLYEYNALIHLNKVGRTCFPTYRKIAKPSFLARV